MTTRKQAPKTRAPKANKNEPAQTSTPISISHCNLTGVEFSADALSAIKAIAEAVEENATAGLQNAEALTKLAEALQANNIRIDTMIRIDNSRVKTQ